LVGANSKLPIETTQEAGYPAGIAPPIDFSFARGRLQVYSGLAILIKPYRDPDIIYEFP